MALVYESDPAFKNLVAVILAADAGFTNLEISLFRMADFNGYPQAESGGIWFVGPPEAAQDLKWMGFNLFNRANNHATEYGVEGMIETDRLLDSLKLGPCREQHDFGRRLRQDTLTRARGASH